MTTTQAAGIAKPATANATALMSMPDSKECADATNDAAERADRAKAEHGSADRDDRSPMPITAAQMQRPMVGARSVRHGYSPLPRCCPPISGKCRLHLVEEAVNLVCVISLVDGSPSKSDSANLIRSQVITHLQTRRDNVQEGIDLIHPIAVVPGGRT